MSNEDTYYACDGQLRQLCANIKLWREGKGFRTDWFNVPEKLMLVVTELAEAMEAYRHLKRSDLGLLQTGSAVDNDAATGRWMNFKEELADAAIRLFDLAASLHVDLEAEVAAKMRVNEGRPYRHDKEC
jgi:NTP pyrophosphatase (non-canonical NTP hydrolase)